MYAPRPGGVGLRIGIALWVMVLGAPGFAHGSEPGQAHPVARFDELALRENRSLRGLKSRRVAVEQAGRAQRMEWPQPRLGYSLDVMAPWMGSHSIGHSVQVSQELPMPGARERMSVPWQAEQELVDAEYAEVQADLLRDLRLDLVELFKIDAQMALLEEEVGLMEDALKVIEALMPVGRAERGDYLQLEIALERAQDRAQVLVASREAVEAALGARVGAGAEPLGDLSGLGEYLTSWTAALPEEELLLEWALSNSPELERSLAQEAVAQAQVTLVDERVRPWPELVVGYANTAPMWAETEPRSQIFQVGFSMPIPLVRGQYGAEASRWQAEAEAVAQERAQREQRLAAEVRAILVELKSDERRLRRYQEELAPLAGDLARDFLIGVELGERSSSEYLLALKQEVELEAEIVELQAGRLRRLVELQRLTGGRLGADTAWAYPQQGGGER